MKPEKGFHKTKTSFAKLGDRKQNPEERQTRLSKVEGVNLRSDFEQRRHGWGQTERKPSCFERGNTDRFKAQCPIWIAKTQRCGDTNQETKNIGGEERK